MGREDGENETRALALLIDAVAYVLERIECLKELLNGNRQIRK